MNKDIVATNREYFFGNEMISDTIMLLTYGDNHPRPECRLFRNTLKRMTHSELLNWLNSPKDNRFNW